MESKGKIPDVSATALRLHHQLIASNPMFAHINTSDIDALVQISEVIHYKAGEQIVAEGDFVDSFFIIIDGKAEILQKKIFHGHVENTIVAVLEKAESIGLGKEGFYSTHGRRTATAIALTDISLLRFEVNDFSRFIKNHPSFDNQLKDVSELMSKLNFLKQTYPFICLSNAEIYSLALKVKDITLAPGSIIFKEGDLADRCYLIREGQVEIYVTRHREDVKIAILESKLLGEAALLTNNPRNASARALTECRLFVLDKNVLSELLVNSKTFANAMIGHMVNRFRPVRNKDIIVNRSTRDGQAQAMLQNPKNQQYYRLSEEGLFIWEQLDGMQSIQDITVAFFRKYKILAPEMICNLLYNLEESGFVHIPTISESLWNAPENVNILVEKVGKFFKKISQIEFSFIHTDPWLTSVYNKGIYVFFSWPFLLFFFLLCSLGFFTFIYSYSTVLKDAAILQPSFWFFLLLLIPISTLTVILHEAGHAFSAKKLGYKIQRLGVGWLFAGPFAYVDTSELWLANQRPRILVNIAGICVDVVVGSIFAILSYFVVSGPLFIYFWLLSLFIYYNAFKNLSPIREYDGYFLLSDSLNCSKLRKLSMNWLVNIFPRTNLNLVTLKQYKAEIAYWIAVTLYLIISAFLLFFLLQSLFEIFLVPSILGISATHFSVLIAILIFSISTISIWNELKQLREMPDVKTDSQILRHRTISSYPLFFQTDPDDMESLVDMAREIRYKADEQIVAQGDFVDSFFLIVSGKVKVLERNVVNNNIENTISSILGPGDAIGLNKEGGFSYQGKRSETVIAIKDALLLRFSITSFSNFMKNSSSFDSETNNRSVLMAKINFIKQTYPFILLSNAEIAKLTEKIEQIQYPANTIIFKEGDVLNNCYLILTGKVEVYVVRNNQEQKLAVLESGLFGEEALLTNTSRNVSVRSLTDCTFLVLNQHLLLEFLNTSKIFAKSMLLFTSRHFHPIRAEGIIAHHSIRDGRTIVMLQNPVTGLYYRLTEEGGFLWHHLNGTQSIQDLTILFHEKYKMFAPEMISNLLYCLKEAGFIYDASNFLFGKFASLIEKIPRLEISFFNTDKWLTEAYQKVCYLFYTLPAQIFFCLLCIIGFTLFINSSTSITQYAQDNKTSFWFFLLLVFLTYLLQKLLHQCAHTFTVKKLGYKVQRITVGFLLTGPFLYGDISPTWLASRKARMLVNISGVYSDLIIMSLFSLLSSLVSEQFSVYLWLISLFLLYRILKNLNPIGEEDGYLILRDALGKQNLRESANLWLFDHLFNHSLKYKVEMSYWLICTLYLTVSASVVFFIIKTVFNIFMIPSLFGMSSVYISIFITFIILSLSLIKIGIDGFNYIKH